MKKVIVFTLLIAALWQTAGAQEVATQSGKVNSLCFMPPSEPIPGLENYTGYVVQYTATDGYARHQGISRNDFEQIRQAMENHTLDKIIVHYLPQTESIEVILKK